MHVFTFACVLTPAIVLQGKQAGSPIRMFASQADNSASAAGAAPKLHEQASVYGCTLTTQYISMQTQYRHLCILPDFGHIHTHGLFRFHEHVKWSPELAQAITRIGCPMLVLCFFILCSSYVHDMLAGHDGALCQVWSHWGWPRVALHCICIPEGRASQCARLIL